MNPDCQSSYSNPETPYDQKFWDNYALFLLKHGISKKYITWYVLRTKQYIADFPSTSVREHSPKHVEGYVISKANDNQLKDWQFTQIVDAIKILFSLGLKSDWAQDYDWEGIVSFHAPEDAKSLSTDDVRVYLEYLAIQRNVAVATQKQALNAIAFLFNKVWETPIGDIGAFAKSKRPKPSRPNPIL